MTTFLFFLTICLNPVLNPIDSSKSRADVEVLLAGLQEEEELVLATEEEVLRLAPCGEKYLNDLAVRPWQMADLNHDGFNDLLVHLKEGEKVFPAVIESKAKGSLSIERLSLANTDPCLRGAVSQLADTSYFLLARFGTIYGLDTVGGKYETFERTVAQLDTLISTSFGFAEAHSIVESAAVRAITFEHLGCPEICPQYTMRLDSKGELLLHRQMGFSHRKQNRWEQTTVPQREVDALLSFAAGLNPKAYDEAYYAAGHQSHVRISFTYSDFTVKVIYDSGLSASLGMQKLYDQFIDWHANADWEKYPIQKH